MFGLNFIIEDLIYIPTGNYNEMYTRPYMMNMPGNSIDIIRNKLEENNTSRITPDILSGYASNIIQPSAVPLECGVNKDWVDNRKFIFLMKISYASPTGLVNKVYLQGYTNYNGITNTGNIDFNLYHYINNIIETSVMSYNTPMGIISEEKLTKLYNVISSKLQYADEIYLQRPTDVISNINALNIQNNLLGINGIESVDKTFTINKLENRSLSSRFDNNISTRYLADVFSTAMVSSQNNEDDFMSDFTFSNNNIKARDILREPSIQDNPFLHHISNIRGYKSATNEFDFSSLMKVDPTIADRFKVLNLTKTYIDPTIANTPEVGEYWHGQDMLTLKAYSLIEACVSLATRYGFSKMNFICSNMTDITGQPYMMVSYFNSFLQLNNNDFNKLLAVFESNFMTEIFNDESSFNTIPLHIEMYVDILGTSKINLGYAGYPATWYTIPTFANSMFSPVVTINKQAFDTMADNLSTAAEYLFNGVQHQNTFY